MDAKLKKIDVEALLKKVPTEWHKVPASNEQTVIMQAMTGALKKMNIALQEEFGDRGKKIFDRVVFETYRDLFAKIKKDLGLGETAKDMAVANFYHDVYMWGIEERIVKATDKEAVAELRYCPCASKFGGPFETAEDCATWRAACEGIANALGPKLAFPEAQKKIPRDSVCQFVFRTK